MGTTLTASKINSSRSRLMIKAFASGILSSFGHDPTFAARNISGEISFSEEAPEQSHLLLNVRADSLQLTDDVSAKDREEILRTMREQVLEMEQYPEIIFESKGVTANKIYEGTYRVTIEGALTLHGQTNTEKLDSNVTVAGGHIRANGDLKIRQTDYGIKLVSVAGGSLKIKDELKITFDIVAQP